MFLGACSNPFNSLADEINSWMNSDDSAQEESTEEETTEEAAEETAEETTEEEHRRTPAGRMVGKHRMKDSLREQTAVRSRRKLKSSRRITAA